MVRSFLWSAVATPPLWNGAKRRLGLAPDAPAPPAAHSKNWRIHRCAVRCPVGRRTALAARISREGRRPRCPRFTSGATPGPTRPARPRALPRMPAWRAQDPVRRLRETPQVKANAMRRPCQTTFGHRTRRQEAQLPKSTRPSKGPGPWNALVFTQPRAGVAPRRLLPCAGRKDVCPSGVKRDVGARLRAT